MAVERAEADGAEQAVAHAILDAAAQDTTPLMRTLRPNPRVIPLLFAALTSPAIYGRPWPTMAAASRPSLALSLLLRAALSSPPTGATLPPYHDQEYVLL